LVTDKPSHERKISDMNQNIENPNERDSVSTFAQQLNELFKDVRSPEEIRKERAELKEREFHAMKRRLEAKTRQRDELKDGVRKVIQQSRDMNERLE
jgi:hypothetical protein